MDLLRYWLVVLIFFVLLLIGYNHKVSAESKSSRSQKDVFIEVTLGAHIPTLIILPYKFGYFSSPNLMIGVEQGIRKFGYDDNSVVVENGKITDQGVFTRWFFENDFSDSFNLLLGLYERTFEVDVRVRIDDTLNTPFGGETKYTLSNLKTEAIVMTLGVGNQWMWDSGIYFGVDYVWLSYLVSGKSASNIESDNSRDNLTDDEKSRAIEDLNKFGKTINRITSGNGYILITLGFSF